MIVLPLPVLLADPGRVQPDVGVIVTATRRLAVDGGLLLGRADDAFVVAAIAGLSLRIGP